MNPIGGTTQTQNPLTPYSSYRDCSQGVCTIYCPQWCYLIFPPPPFGLDDDGSGGGSGGDFSPLIIALAGVLASAFILVTYYILVSKYCKRRSNMVMSLGFISGHRNDAVPEEASRQGSAPATGLDESVIKSISVFKYEKMASFKDFSDCSVCLSEFQENETLRLLPKCSHAFHVACIDTWLKSHSSCPLCRADINAPDGGAAAAGQTSRAAALEYRRGNDQVVVIGDLGDGPTEQTVVVVAAKAEEGLRETERVLQIDPSPVGSSVCHSRICIAEILSISEEE